VTADQFNTFQAQLTLTAGHHSVGIASTSPCGDATGDSLSLTATAPPVPPSSGGSNQNQPSSPPKPILTPRPPSATLPPGQMSASGKLVLTIISPLDGATTKNAFVFVRGTTSALAKVQIAVNGTVVAQTLLPDTSFGLSAPLELHDNTITVSAAGNNTLISVTLHITRLPTANPSASHSGVPWWRTLPGIVTAGTSIIVVLGLTVWFIRLRLVGASKHS
jgi:hypothetical protein